MWFGTPGGLSVLSGGRWTTIAAGQDGLPSAEVISLCADAGGILWVGTAAGLAYIASGRVHVPRGAPASLTEPVHGIAADTRGGLWLATSSRILSLSRAALLDGTASALDVREYGLADGLNSLETLKRQRSVIAGADGRIWFALNRSLSVVDPTRALAGSPPAIVHLRAVSADGTAMDPAKAVRLASPRQRLTFGFVGLSLAVPERIRFRYRLDGFDGDWSAPTAAPRSGVHQPGSRRLHVSRDGVEQRWPVERIRSRDRGRYRPRVLADVVVPHRRRRLRRAGRARTLPAAAAPDDAAAQRPLRGAAGRAHPHRAGAARHAAAGIPQRLDAAARRRRDAAGRFAGAHRARRASAR